MRIKNFIIILLVIICAVGCAGCKEKGEMQMDKVEYKEGSYTKKMWIEDEKSLKEKLSLIKQHNLGGVASWEKGMEPENFWTFLKNEI